MGMSHLITRCALMFLGLNLLSSEAENIKALLVILVSLITAFVWQTQFRSLLFNAFSASLGICSFRGGIWVVRGRLLFVVIPFTCVPVTIFDLLDFLHFLVCHLSLAGDEEYTREGGYLSIFVLFVMFRFV